MGYLGKVSFSPYITDIIQEIVDRDGWQEGNSVCACVLTGEDQGASDEDNARDFESFENVEDPDDGGDGLNHPERIPKLYIYYSITSSVLDVDPKEIFQVRSTVLTNDEVVLSLDKSQLNSKVRVDLYNAGGAHVANICTDLPGGDGMQYRIPSLPSGMYIIRAESPEFSVAEKVIIR